MSLLSREHVVSLVYELDPFSFGVRVCVRF